MTITILLLILLGFMTLASAYCSGTETALFSLSSLKVKTYKTDADPRKRLIAQLLSQPRDLLVTVFMLNTLVNILLQNVASSFFGESAGWDLKVGVPLFLTLVLGEIVPKNIGIMNNEWISYHFAPSINFFHQALGSIRKWTIAITHPVSRTLFFFLNKEPSISKEELEHVLNTSEETGTLHKEEAELVWGYIKFQDATVKEIMAPKEDILHYDMAEPVSKLTHLFVDEECSRVPVCKNGLDTVVGIIHAKQFFLHGAAIKSGTELLPLISKPFFVPETTGAKTLLRQFDETGQVIALAVDEYGSISGLATREDIAELIIGDIADKRDQKALYTVAGTYEIIASGKLELEEFNHIFDANLESASNMVTIGGWLIEELGEIPKGGTTFRTDAFLFQILSADPNRIRRLYIRKLVDQEKEA